MSHDPSAQDSDPAHPFADDAYRTFGIEYIKEMIVRMKEAEQRIRRALFTIISLGALFAVIWTNSATEVSILSVKLSNLGVILAAIPVVTAYQFNNITELDLDEQFAGRRLVEVLRATHPQVAKRHWVGPLLPLASELNGPAANFYAENVGDAVITVIRGIVTYLGPIALCAVEVYLYAQRVDWGAGSLVATAAFTAVFIAMGLHSLAVQMKAGHFSPPD